MPGSQRGVPGSQRGVPGSQRAGPGSQRAGPGSQRAGPGSQRGGSGSQGAETASQGAETTSRGPWILGARGAPLEAPENTAVGFATALGLGLDGIAADLRACRSGEVVVHADADLERTTDGHGRIAEKDWTELADLDAGANFHARFRGEKLLLAEELLALSALHGAASNLVVHVHGDVASHGYRDAVSQREALAHRAASAPRAALLRTSEAFRRASEGVVARFAGLARELAPHASIRVASGERETVLAARDAGLSALVVAEALDERLFEQVAIDRPAAVSAPVAAWESALGRASWPVERWAFDVDAPDELLAACRAGLHAITTREPRRALAARKLAQLAPAFDGAWPIELPSLDVAPEPGTRLAGDWSGSWNVRARVVNPFAFSVRVAAEVLVRRGAFDVTGLPRTFELEAGASELVDFALSGGARRPGSDPLFAVRCAWRAGPGRAAGHVDLDAPLVRTRHAVADSIPRRLFLLRDGPRDPAATLVLRRRAHHVTVALESLGILADPRVVVRCLGRTYTGARGVRVPLPADFDQRAEGIPFACGLVAWQDGERVTRVWSGGLTDGPDAGAPGVLWARSRA